MVHSFSTGAQAQISGLATALQQALLQGHLLDATQWPELDNDQVLAVQQQLAQSWASQPVPTYWKSGGPTRAQPLNHAPLPPMRVHASPADLRHQAWSMRGVEAEIALRLACDVDAQQAAELHETDTAALIDAMTVSIEVVDSRWQQQLQAPESLKAADLLCHGALVLGAWQPYRLVDWAAQRCWVQIGTTQVERVGTHSLNDPAWLLSQWLRHVTRHFGVVPAGTVVTTGSWCGLLMAQAGDAVTVRFDGIGEVSVVL